MQLFFRKSGHGKPLVILHGLFGISDNWNSLAKLWSEHFTVYAVDLRNHGQSPHDETWNYSVMAEDVLELIEAEHLRDVVLLGHSMGGKVAMRLALDHPGEISKLVVADIAPRKYEVHNEDVVQALLQVHPENLASRKEAEIILRKFLREEGVIQFLLKNLYWKEVPGEEKKLAWRFNIDVIARKHAVVSEATNEPAPCNVETLFIRGENSHYISQRDENEIKTVFPHSKIITIPNAGHWVHADQPKLFYEAVMRMMNE